MRYRVLQPLHLPAGTVLQLSPAQRQARGPWLLEIPGALQQATAALQFKAGEEIGIPGAYPASVPHLLQPLDVEVAEPPAPLAAASPAAAPAATPASAAPRAPRAPRAARSKSSTA